MKRHEIWNKIQRVLFKCFFPPKSAQWFIILLEKTLQLWEVITTVFYLGKQQGDSAASVTSRICPMQIFDKSGWVTPTVFSFSFSVKLWISCILVNLGPQVIGCSFMDILSFRASAVKYRKRPQSFLPHTLRYHFIKRAFISKFFFASEIEAHSKATVQCSENISVML